MASEQLNGLIEIDTGPVYEACLARMKAREQRITNDREKLIEEMMSRPPQCRWSWKKFRYVAIPRTRENTIALLKRAPFGDYSAWQEVEIIGEFAHDQVVQLERALAKVPFRSKMYLSTYMAALLHDYFP